MGKSLKIAGLSWRSPAFRSDRGDNILFECPKRKSGCPQRPCKSRNLRRRSMESKSTTHASGQAVHFAAAWIAGRIVLLAAEYGSALTAPHRLCSRSAGPWRKRCAEAMWTVPCRHRRTAFCPLWSVLGCKKWMSWDARGVVQSQCFLPPRAQKCVPWCWLRRSIPGQLWARTDKVLKRRTGEALLRMVWPFSRPLYRTALARMYGDPRAPAR